MSEFNLQAESVDVEQIMGQIRARIREKRGVDYTEEQIREMAGVKLERFFDPKNVRSDLIEHYPTQSFKFDPESIYRSSRGAAGKLLYRIRWLLRPVLKLFFNPAPIVHALHVQASRADLDALTYEVLNNLVVEMTRLSIDVKNHRMRVESIAGRLDFAERRARALESIVQYRSGSDALAEVGGVSQGQAGDETPGGTERKRRRRRRGRRRAATTPPAGETPGAATPKTSSGAGASEASSSLTPSDPTSASGDAPGNKTSVAKETPAPLPAESGGERPPES